MANKKPLFPFFLSIFCRKAFIILLLPFILVPVYTSFSNRYDANGSPNISKKPTHIGIIMDGNGRWGEKESGNRSYGHENAKQAVKEMIAGCLEQGIPYVTLYAFSSENWNRPKKEVDTIFKVITEGIAENFNLFMENNIKFRVVGDTANIPSFCWSRLKEVIETTKCNTRLHLTVAINYGGRAEAVAASEAMVNDFLPKIVNEFLNKGFNSRSCFGDFIQFIDNYRAKITPAIYQKYLYTSELPNVDLVIRTGGRKRMSNFLPWQAAYAELHFTSVLWPSFKKEDLMEALSDFQKEPRTFGKVMQVASHKTDEQEKEMLLEAAANAAADACQKCY